MDKAPADKDPNEDSLLYFSEYDQPIREWNETRRCFECGESTTFECCEYKDGAQQSFCSFCGWEDELFAGIDDLDDAGWG